MKQVGSLTLIREMNTSLVLDALKSAQSLSKLDIAKFTGLSIPTVTKILSNMLSVGVVIEAGVGDSDGGRRPVLYDLNQDGAFVIGSEIGDDHINSIVVDFVGEIVAQVNTPILKEDSEFVVFDKTLSTISEAIRQSKRNTSRFLGLGIGIAGDVDAEQGIVRRATRLNWNNVPIKSIIENAFHIPTFVDENVRLLTYAENWFGAGKEYDDIICLRIGDDISAGHMVNRSLFTGKHGLVGQNIGHMVIASDGEICECGGRGCVKTILSADAIVKYCKERIHGANTRLKADRLTMKQIADAAHEKDVLALMVMDYVGKNLAVVLKNLAICFDPDLIIVGGGIALAGDVLFEPTRRYYEAFTKDLNINVKICPSLLGRDSFAIGAATLVLNEVFSYPGKFAL